MAGEARAPAERMTSLVALAVRGVLLVPAITKLQSRSKQTYHKRTVEGHSCGFALGHNDVADHMLSQDCHCFVLLVVDEAMCGSRSHVFSSNGVIPYGNHSISSAGASSVHRAIFQLCSYRNDSYAPIAKVLGAGKSGRSKNGLVINELDGFWRR